VFAPFFSSPEREREKLQANRTDRRVGSLVAGRKSALRQLLERTTLVFRVFTFHTHTHTDTTTSWGFGAEEGS
jgi:hypothetical protein